MAPSRALKNDRNQGEAQKRPSEIMTTATTEMSYIKNQRFLNRTYHFVFSIPPSHVIDRGDSEQPSSACLVLFLDISQLHEVNNRLFLVC